MAKSKNGYMTFIMESKNRDRQNGINQPDSYYAAKWASLSDEEKKRYKDKANGRSSGRGFQLTSGHTASAPPGAMSADDAMTDDLEQDVVNEEMLEMRNMIEALLRCDAEQVAQIKIVIGATNVMIRTTEGTYMPMELGLTKYTVEQGIVDHYHRFTDPGPVPMGYMNKAKLHIDTTHKTPITNFDQAIGRRNRQVDFKAMMDEISIFLSDCFFQYKGRSRCFIFTRDDMMEQLRGSLDFYIRTSEHEEWMDMWQQRRIVIADVAYLLFCMHNAAGSNVVLPLCADVPYNTQYDYKPGSCEFHTTADNNFCALGISKRWCYLLSDCMLPLYPEIEAVEGKHLPLSIQSFIHIEESDAVSWSGERPFSSRRSRTYGQASVNGDNHRPQNQAAAASNAGESATGQPNPRFREFDAEAQNTDPRTVGGVGRGMRRT